MKTYTVLFRMMGDVEEVCDDEGKPLGHDVVIRTPHWGFATETWRGGFRSEEGPRYYDTAEMDMDFPDDAAARAWAVAFNGLCLDPWRVDWVYGPDDTAEEVYVFCDGLPSTP